MTAVAAVGEPEARTRWDAAQRAQREARLNRIEDYLFIGGDRLSAARAAKRLGVSPRTVVRYRAALRELAGVS
jgi:predicted DNA-binding transcriptional regulator YafY